MPRLKTYPCHTCRTYEPHRQPKDDRERDIIRRLAEKKPNAYVHDYWICVTGDRDCRNIRRAGRAKPFDPPQKMPRPE